MNELHILVAILGPSFLLWSAIMAAAIMLWFQLYRIANALEQLVARGKDIDAERADLEKGLP